MTEVESQKEFGTPIEIVLATGNPGKVSELKDLLGSGFLVVTSEALGADLPEETGATFSENATLKARSVAQQTGRLAIADDSGIEVVALEGAPGVHTARYAGPMATDADNRRLLLRELEGVEENDRAARFVSVIAIAFSEEDLVIAEGTCEGRIAMEERGSGGFGYDSIFELSSGKTMAEIDPIEKNRISHRGMAMRKASALLSSRFTGAMEETA